MENDITYINTDLTPSYQLYMEALTQESPSHEPILTKTRLVVYKSEVLDVHSDVSDTAYHIDAYRIIDNKMIKISSKLKDTDMLTLLNKLKVIAGLSNSDFVLFSKG